MSKRNYLYFIWAVLLFLGGAFILVVVGLYKNHSGNTFAAEYKTVDSTANSVLDKIYKLEIYSRIDTSEGSLLYDKQRDFILDKISHSSDKIEVAKILVLLDSKKLKEKDSDYAKEIAITYLVKEYRLYSLTIIFIVFLLAIIGVSIYKKEEKEDIGKVFLILSLLMWVIRLTLMTQGKESIVIDMVTSSFNNIFVFLTIPYIKIKYPSLLNRILFYKSNKISFSYYEIGVVSLNVIAVFFYCSISKSSILNNQIDAIISFSCYVLFSFSLYLTFRDRQLPFLFPFLVFFIASIFWVDIIETFFEVEKSPYINMVIRTIYSIAFPIIVLVLNYSSKKSENDELLQTLNKGANGMIILEENANTIWVSQAFKKRTNQEVISGKSLFELIPVPNIEKTFNLCLDEGFSAMDYAIEGRRSQLTLTKIEVDNQIRIIVEETDITVMFDFIQRLGHNLKAPLTAPLNIASVLKNEKLVKSNHSLYQDINYILAGINQGLLYSLSVEIYGKLSTNTFYPDSTFLRIDSFLRGLPIQFESDLYVSNIKMDLDIEDELVLYAPKESIKGILNNILTNSFKFVDVNKSQSYINICAKTKGQFIEIKVEDNGKGINPDELSKIKEGISPRNRLGMKIVQKCVKQLKGEVVIESELGIGTSITLLFPIKK
jgi:signal transduction histidine kinase